MAYGNRDYELAVANVTAVYHEKAYWWPGEAVMLLQRLLLNVIATFVTEMLLLRSVVTTLVCLLFLLLHVTIRPMRHPGGHAAQTTFQASGWARLSWRDCVEGFVLTAYTHGICRLHSPPPRPRPPLHRHAYWQCPSSLVC
jgi:hypothetical protein